MSILVHEKKNRFRRWELALLLGVAFASLMGSWLSGQQAALTDQVVRLHVVGASDSAEDQMVKLRVRDAVLEEAGPWLEGITDQTQAQVILAEHLEELARAGAEAAGNSVSVTAQVEEDAWFPTKRYTDFSLPAGRYTALKITLGEGEGRNWWCVVFPPLCLGSVTETVAQRAGSFSDGQVKMITGEDEGYLVKFRALEFWNELTEKLG